VGLVSTVVWYIFGAQDHHHLKNDHRQQQQSVGKALADYLNLDDYVTIGSTDLPVVDHKIYQWRYTPLSPTRLAAWFPLFVLAYWLLVICIGLIIVISAQVRSLIVCGL
jgi:hypothetical protein